MARFTNFNQILSQTSGNDDAEDEDEEENNDYNLKEDTNFDEEDLRPKKETVDLERIDSSSTQGIKIQPVTLPEQEPLQEGFTDNNFWRIDTPTTIDYDALLAEIMG